MYAENYVTALTQTAFQGDATEHTFRPALKTLIEQFDPAIIATNEPARQRCGAPDFVLTKNQRPLGYIETKSPGKNLDSPEFKEQFDRYLEALPNIIFTDYLQFQFWQEKTKIAEIKIGEIHNGKIRALKENFTQFENLLHNFCNFKGQLIRDADELAALLAVKARVLSGAIQKALTDTQTDYANRSLQGHYEAFQNVLIPDIDIPTFSDVYAQTLAYGMFVARNHHKGISIFTRIVAVESIPKSHPFLRKFFGYIASVDLDDRIRWVVDELADVLQAANLSVIMEGFGKQTQTEDPTIHFYEHFLAAYNPAVRKNRGVYYTPLPAVQYIIQSVNSLLKDEFNCPNGIADNTKIEYTISEKGSERIIDLHKVQILDPATGTGTFLAEIVKHIHSSVVSQGKAGAWNSYVAQDLLPRLHGFEILMAPYAMAHLKLDTILEQSGYRFENDQRVGIYLTNSLEEGIKITERFGFVTWLTDEAEGANRVKKETPVMVVLGNPPYNVSTMNKSRFSEALIERYKKGEGVESEQNIQPLSDDYIKFIALGQKFIEDNPAQCGILAYISNNSFLSGLIHRQMRKELMQTFGKIYILNLHGSARKKESTPDGGKDENIFNIQQGTSINIFVKLPKSQRQRRRTVDTVNGSLAQVFYADLFGKRQIKFDFLSSKKLKQTGFSPLNPAAPYYFFVPKDFTGQRKYNKGFKLDELFRVGSSGIETKRDSLFIDYDKQKLIDRMQTLFHGDYDWRFEEQYRINDTNGYEITRLLKKAKYNRPFIRQIEYRPFDIRWIYYDPDLLARAFYVSMQHLLDKENIGLIVKRGFDEPRSALGFVSKHLIDRRVWSRPGMQGAEQIFPLYVYPLGTKTPNLNQAIVTKIEHLIGKKIKPEKLFDYIYAVLHSPKYRKDYEEFLKIDFPHVPYPESAEEFERFAKFGTKLRQLHLVEKKSKRKTTFPIADGNQVEEIRYSPPSEGAGGGRVYINKTQYFNNVSESAWQFYVGGYQPLQKYLKDRKGRVLTFEEIEHYQDVVSAIEETVEIMNAML